MFELRAWDDRDDGPMDDPRVLPKIRAGANMSIFLSPAQSSAEWLVGGLIDAGFLWVKPKIN